MFGFLVGEALRDLRRAGPVALSAIMLITLSLAALGGFWLVSAHLGRAVNEWRNRVRLIVYLKREPTLLQSATLVDRVQAVPGVASVRYIGRAEALETLKRALGREASVVDQLPANPLPASIEVTPAPSAATPEGARVLFDRLSALPEADEVFGGVEWAERLSRWRRALATVGVGVGCVLGLAALLTVTTATTLVIHARRHETEIMRLSGAPELTVRLPLLLQGMVQGLVGAVLAVIALVAAYRLSAPRIESLMNVAALGLPEFGFLPPVDLAALVLAGTVLGGLGGWLARGRRQP